MKTTGALVAAVLGVVLGGLGSARADEVVLDCTRDNTVFESGNSLSNGAGDGLFAGRTLSAGRRRGLLRFDLAVIPAGATITSASVELTVLISAGMDGPGELHRLSADWGEGASVAAAGMGAPAQRGDATWSDRFFGESTWATPGGDFAPAASAAITVVTTNLVQVFPSTGLMVADVQGWLAAPAQNFGWALLGDEVVGGNARKFASREFPDPGQRPRLRVVYTTGCAADFNHSGGVGVQDIFDFLVAYFAADPRADFNGVGGVSVQDIFDFLGAYFAGCS